MSEFTTATAPWWLVALLTGVLTILSTGMGAGISFWSLRQSDRRRIEAEHRAESLTQETKRQEKLRTAAAEFLVASRGFVDAYRDNFIPRTDAGGSTVYLVVDAPMVNNIAIVYDAYWPYVFLASERQRELAKKLMRSTRKFEFRKQIDGHWRYLNAQQYRSASDKYVQAKRDFVAAVMQLPGDVDVD